MNNTKKQARQARRKATKGFALIQEFFNTHDPQEADEALWEQFRWAMICSDRGDMSVVERQNAFYFYERLKDLLQGSAELIGVR